MLRTKTQSSLGAPAATQLTPACPSTSASALVTPSSSSTLEVDQRRATQGQKGFALDAHKLQRDTNHLHAAADAWHA